MPKYDGFPLGVRYLPKQIPVADALRHTFNALFEADIMISTCLREREVQMEIVRTYKDKNGRAYKKAQKAALEADRLDAHARKFRDLKLGLWGEMVRLWTVYTGDGTKGIIAAHWLCGKKSIEEIAKLTNKQKAFVTDTLTGIATFMLDLTYCREHLPATYKQDLLNKMEEYRTAS